MEGGVVQRGKTRQPRKNGDGSQFLRPTLDDSTRRLVKIQTILLGRVICTTCNHELELVHFLTISNLEVDKPFQEDGILLSTSLIVGNSAMRNLTDDRYVVPSPS